jgi:Luciferase-like monooxygenase
MKFGAMLYQSSGTISAVEFARIAECGCDSVWLGEHTHRPVTDDERPLMKKGELHNHAYMHDPWVTLGAIAASTTNVILGTAVGGIPRGPHRGEIVPERVRGESTARGLTAKGSVDRTKLADLVASR